MAQGTSDSYLPTNRSKQMPGTVFTLGYQLRDSNEFVSILRSAGVDIVVDVRELPWSMHIPVFPATHSALIPAGNSVLNPATRST